jgi:uroporphyrinogen decarboxylase
LDYPLSRGTPQEVEEEVKRLIKEIAPGGGYCLGSSNSIPEYVPLENYKAMLDSGLKYGKYPISL